MQTPELINSIAIRIKHQVSWPDFLLIGPCQKGHFWLSGKNSVKILDELGLKYFVNWKLKDE